MTDATNASFTCPTCGATWSVNYCPQCFRTIDRGHGADAAAATTPSTAGAQKPIPQIPIADPRAFRSTRTRNGVIAAAISMAFAMLARLASGKSFVVGPDVFGELIGATMALGAIPFVIGVAVPGRRGLIASSVVALLLGSLATYGGWAANNVHEPQAASSFHFRPVGSEIGVDFPGKPKVTRSRIITVDGAELETTKAEHAVGLTFLRAESFAIAEGYKSKLTREAMLTWMRSYAEMEGMVATEMHCELPSNGPAARMRTHKRVEGSDGRQVPVIYDVRWYFGSKSAMVVYVGAPASSYPTREGTDFLRSLAQKP